MAGQNQFANSPMSREIKDEEVVTSAEEIDLSGGHQLKRGLKSRHIQ